MLLRKHKQNYILKIQNVINGYLQHAEPFVFVSLKSCTFCKSSSNAHFSRQKWMNESWQDGSVSKSSCCHADKLSSVPRTHMAGENQPSIVVLWPPHVHHSCSCTHIYTHSCTNSCTLIYTHIHLDSHTNARPFMHIHIHMYTRPHSYIHTHTQSHT